MEYSKHSFSDLAVEARVASFNPEGGFAEHHAVLRCLDLRMPFAQQLDSMRQAVGRLAALLPKARPVFARYFLSDAANQAQGLADGWECAVSVVQQPPLNGSKLALWIYYQEDARPVPVANTAMWMVERGDYRHLWLGSASLPGATSYQATYDMLDAYASQLGDLGLSLADNCLRTWFFVRDVDVNYRGVVEGRNRLFDRNGLTADTHFIASTGIGGVPARPDVSVLFDAYAVGGIKPEQVKYLHAPSHLNPTHEYGVAFERGTAVDYADRRHVFISGTASINNRGEVEHPGDIVRQTARMLENVEALLADADCGWQDVAHCIVYLRDTADYDVVSEIFVQRLPDMPRVITLAPVCRPGWLVEVECMAIKQLVIIN